MYAARVKSTVANTNAIFVSTSCRVIGLYIQGGAGNGTFALLDGGATGAKLDAYVVSAGNTVYALLPGTGIQFYTNVYVCVPSGSAMTIHFDSMGN